jgi:hypothetical protein
MAAEMLTTVVLSLLLTRRICPVSEAHLLQQTL